VVDSAIVWGDVVIVKKETFLYYPEISFGFILWQVYSHLLKLVTGVDISTRAVSSSGRPGNDVKRRSRTAAAAPNSVAFLLSMLMVKL
jgi:hypothetical protein